MRVLIRVDASRKIGTGHVMRCLALAQAVEARGGAVSFACRSLPGDLIAYVRSRGYRVSVLPEGGGDRETRALAGPRSEAADWLVVDHYGIDAGWESAARAVARRILVIDDLANRPHDCDLLVDQTFGEEPGRYRGLLPRRCRRLIGSRYALLARPFLARRRRGLGPWPPVERRLHVFFGGSDAGGCTLRFSPLIAGGIPDWAQQIAIGLPCKDGSALAALARAYPGRIRVKRGVRDMSLHMSGCTAAVGAAGMATWERACMGLPSAVLATASNQEPILRRIARRGLVRYWGPASAISNEDFLARLRDFLSDAHGLTALRKAGLDAVDGLGTDRVAEAMKS